MDTWNEKTAWVACLALMGVTRESVTRAGLTQNDIVLSNARETANILRYREIAR